MLSERRLDDSLWPTLLPTLSKRRFFQDVMVTRFHDSSDEGANPDSSEDEPITSRFAQTLREVGTAKKVDMAKKPGLYDALRHFRTQRSIALLLPP